MYPAICDAVHRELDELEEKYSGGAQMSTQDLDVFDKIVHALKSLATYEAMKGADSGRTERRYREYEQPIREYRRY